MRTEYVQAADALAEWYHAGQLDKQGKPYVEHPRRVAASLRTQHPTFVAAALLHDVLEDTTATVDDLRRNGIPDPVIDLVEVLTRDKDNESYETFIERVAESPRARQIKLADLLDNTDPTRGPISDSLQKRYHAALKRLILGL
jgi:(p)ppGpp synthase/HD superfamily hydrolase